jgi:tRNA-binding EMAP/Myf-like protein
VRYTEQAVSLQRFKAVRAAIIETIFTHPTLDKKSAVVSVGVDSEELVQYFSFDENAEKPNFVIQTMRVTINQRITFTGGEL